MNDMWAYWIAASINHHFADNVESDSNIDLVVFFEGLTRTEAQINSRNVVEVRFTGPLWTMLKPTRWRAQLIINCVLQTIMDEKVYDIWRMFGKVDAAFAMPIIIKNYGSVDEGMETEQGCLSLITNKQDIVNNFLGQVDPSLKRVQGEVTAHYQIDLED
jgi:hypothetical protein